MMRILALGALLWAGAVQADIPVKTVTSPGGLSAWVLEEPAIPFTALNIMFSGGAALDPPDKRGAAFMMTGLLEEGAGDLDSQAFAAAKEALSASFSFDVSDDTLSISVRVLTENRAEALALLKTALMQPRFDPDAVERVRQQVSQFWPQMRKIRQTQRSAFGQSKPLEITPMEPLTKAQKAPSRH